jgi:aryl-alcohol dehydrogenase-like predicted oxidoreductase
MQTRSLGDQRVSALALGGARLSLASTPRDRALDTIRAAVSDGIDLVDTAAAYTPAADAKHHNEHLFREALAGVCGGDLVAISTKGGHYRSADGFPVDGRPERIRADCEGSLRALRREVIDLYFLHWPDPKVPVEESVGALADLRAEGKVRMIGVSNFSADALRAVARFGIAAVQNPFSHTRSDRRVLDAAEELGIAFLAYSPVAGAETSAVARELAEEHGCSPQRAAIAWVLAQSPEVIAVIGPTRTQTLSDCLGALDLDLGRSAAIC